MLQSLNWTRQRTGSVTVAVTETRVHECSVNSRLPVIDRPLLHCNCPVLTSLLAPDELLGYLLADAPSDLASKNLVVALSCFEFRSKCSYRCAFGDQLWVTPL